MGWPVEGTDGGGTGGSGIGASNGGDGPVGGAGGIISPNPSLPVPGLFSFTNPSYSLGAAYRGGQIGGQPISEEIPGDLGALYLDLNKVLLLTESNRYNANLNGFCPSNQRFRGHREANKFNLSMQKTVTMCANLFLTLKTANTLLETSEANDLYPTDTEISNVYYVTEQMNYKEWLIGKDANKQWYV